MPAFPLVDENSAFSVGGDESLKGKKHRNMVEFALGTMGRDFMLEMQQGAADSLRNMTDCIKYGTLL